MRPQVNDNMSIEDQVAYAWVHRDRFAAIRSHNLAVGLRRRRGCDVTAPENQYLNPWVEDDFRLIEPTHAEHVP